MRPAAIKSACTVPGTEAGNHSLLPASENSHPWDITISEGPSCELVQADQPNAVTRAPKTKPIPLINASLAIQTSQNISLNPFSRQSIQQPPANATKTERRHTTPGDVPRQSERLSQPQVSGTIPKDGRPSFAPPPQTIDCRPPRRTLHLLLLKPLHPGGDFDQSCTTHPRETKPNLVKKTSQDAIDFRPPNAPAEPADDL